MVIDPLTRDSDEMEVLSKGTISKMLIYNKGLSKETIRILATHFKLNQEIFNQPYKLENDINRKIKNAAVMKTEM
ncbi:MAG: hypothetical protein KA270_03430 [Saprospiraceae bacterium]|nr:hypothetical protein [Saprospiraceae bacterium]MBP6566191.1 hypothetical protein [Saprospiraceae bacterium]